jgi:hypothetical protein
LSGYFFFLSPKIFPVDTWDEAGLLGMAGCVVRACTLHLLSCPSGKYLSDAKIDVDPATESGTDRHPVAEHIDGGCIRIHPDL